MNHIARFTLFAALLAIPVPALAGESRQRFTRIHNAAAAKDMPPTFGFTVDVKPTHDLAEISKKAGVPEKLQGCL